MLNGTYGQQDRWYAGYYLLGYEAPVGEGVLGELFTIDPYVWYYQFICEWVCVILDYSPLYWVQVGYTEDHRYAPQEYLLYYYEKFDESSWLKSYSSSGPIGGTWHTYYTAHPYAYGESNDRTEWRFYVDTSYLGNCFATPYLARDYQASVETTTGQIIIDGSHFRDLCRLTKSKDWYWRLWTRHVPNWNSPYSLVQLSHYEFEAYGGG